MKILIAGSGIAGSYLYRLLVMQGFPKGDIALSDIPPTTACGCHPCAWGTGPQIFPLLKEVGLDPWRYILSPAPIVALDGELVRSALMTINKPNLLCDLTDGQPIVFPQDVSPAKYDRILDCTGEARAFSSILHDDIKAFLSQSRFACRHYIQPAFHWHNKLGYSWAMPLLGSVHIGIGGLQNTDMPSPAELGIDCGKLICGCFATVRLTGPVFPLVNGKVWAVGEAGGIVEPLFGAGIISAMLSAKALVDNWDNPKGYETRIKHEMGFFIQNGQIIRKLNGGGKLGLKDFFAFQRTLPYHGFSMGPHELLRVLRRINQSLKR